MTPHPHQETADGFTPLKAELPLDGLEAFRLASFGIEYVPQYAPVVVDRYCATNAFYVFRKGYQAKLDAAWVSRCS